MMRPAIWVLTVTVDSEVTVPRPSSVTGMSPLVTSPRRTTVARSVAAGAGFTVVLDSSHQPTPPSSTASTTQRAAKPGVWFGSAPRLAAGALRRQLPSRRSGGPTPYALVRPLISQQGPRTPVAAACMVSLWWPIVGRVLRRPMSESERTMSAANAGGGTDPALGQGSYLVTSGTKMMRHVSLFSLLIIQNGPELLSRRGVR